MSLRLRSGSPAAPQRAASPRHGPTDSPKEIRLSAPKTSFSEAQLKLEADTSASSPAERPPVPVTPDNPKQTRKGLSRRRGRYKKKKVKRDPLKLLPGSRDEEGEGGEAREGRPRTMSADNRRSPSRGSSPYSNSEVSEVSEDPSGRSSEDAINRYSEELRLYDSRSGSSDLEDKVFPAEPGNLQQSDSSGHMLAPSFRGSTERKSDDLSQGNEAMDIDHSGIGQMPSARAISELTSYDGEEDGVEGVSRPLSHHAQVDESEKMATEEQKSAHAFVVPTDRIDAIPPPEDKAMVESSAIPVDDGAHGESIFGGELADDGPPVEDKGMLEVVTSQPDEEELRAEASGRELELEGEEQSKRSRGSILGVVPTEKDVDALKDLVDTLDHYEPADGQRNKPAYQDVRDQIALEEQGAREDEMKPSSDANAHLAAGIAAEEPDYQTEALSNELDQYFLARESGQNSGPVPPLLMRDDEGQPLPLDGQSDTDSNVSQTHGQAGIAVETRIPSSAKVVLGAEDSGYTASRSQLGASDRQSEPTERGSSFSALPADLLPESFSRTSTSSKSKKKRIVRPTQESSAVYLEEVMKAEIEAQEQEQRDQLLRGGETDVVAGDASRPGSFGNQDSIRGSRRKIIRPAASPSLEQDAPEKEPQKTENETADAQVQQGAEEATDDTKTEKKGSVLDWLPGSSSAPAVRKENNEYKSGEVLVGWNSTSPTQDQQQEEVVETRPKRSSTMNWINDVLRQRRSFVEAPPEAAPENRRASATQQKRNSQVSLVTDNSDTVQAVIPARTANDAEPRGRVQSTASSVPTIGEDDLSRWIRNSVELKQQDSEDGLYGRGAIPTDIYGRPLPGYEAFLPNRRGARSTQRAYKSKDDGFNLPMKLYDGDDRKDYDGESGISRVHEPVPSESGKVSIEEDPNIDLSEFLTTKSASGRKNDAQSRLGGSGPARSLPPNLYSDASSDTGSMRGLSRFYRNRESVVDDAINRHRRLHGVYYMPSSDLIQCYEAIKVDQEMKPNRVTLDKVVQGSFEEEVARESKLSDSPARRREPQRHLYDLYDNISDESSEYSSFSDRTDFVNRWLDHLESASMDGDGRYVSVGHLHKEKEMLQTSSKRQLQSATKRFEHDIEHVGRTYGHDNEGVSGRLHELGVLYMATNKWHRAKSCFEQALVFRKQHFEEHHPRIGDTHYNLGVLHKARKKFTEGAANFAQAAEIYMQCYGDGHEETRDALHNLVECRDSALGKRKSWFPRLGRQRIDEADEDDEGDE